MSQTERRADDASEMELVRRAKNGDVDAFMELVGRSDANLRALGYSLLGDRDAMDDALQETYVSAFGAIQGFRGGSGFATWLYRIAYNVCLSELRRRSRVSHTSIDEALERPASRPDPADVAVGRADLAVALAELPPEQRAAVLLVDAQGFDYGAAAAILGVPLGTIGSRLFNARSVLRRVLKGEAK